MGYVITFLVLVVYLGGKFTENLIGDRLMEVAKNSSKGIYTIGYRKATFNIFSGELDLHHFEFKIDSTDQEALKKLPITNKNLYQFKCPHFYLDIENLYLIYFTKKLKVNGIFIENPHVELINYPTYDKPSTLSKETGNLYYLISDYLKLFKVANLKVKEASFKYEEYGQDKITEINLNSLTFGIQNLLLDSAADKDKTKFFYTEDFEFSARDQKFILPDSLHMLSFDQILISTDESRILFKNFKLKRIPDLDIPDSAIAHLNHYDIELPEFDLEGVDFKKAYNENHLDIASIILSAPNIWINNRNNELIKSDKINHLDNENKGNSIAEILTHFFSGVSVDTFNIKDGRLDLNLADKTRYFAKNINLHLDNFHLDTTLLNQGRFFPHYEDMSFSIENYEIDLPDSIHSLKVDHFGFSTKKSTLFAKNISFNTNYSQKHLNYLKSMGKDDLYSIDIPELNINGYNIENMFLNREFAVEQIKLSHPKVHIFSHPDLKKSNSPKTQIDFNNLYPLVSKFATSISINEFIIDSANIEYTQTQHKTKGLLFVENFSFMARKFNLDREAHQRKSIFYAEDIGFQINGINLNMPQKGHVIQADQITFSSLDEIINLKDFSLKPLSGSSSNQAEKYTINTTELKLKGMDLKALIYNKRFEFDTIQFMDANIKIVQEEHFDDTKDETIREEGSKSIGDFAKNISVNDLAFRNINFSFLKQKREIIGFKNADLEILNYQVDSLKLRKNDFVAKYDDLFYQLSDFRFNLPDSIHILQVDYLDASVKKGTSRILNLKLFPKTTQVPDSANIFKVTIPEIISTGSVAYHNYFNKKHDYGNLTIKNPKIDLLINQQGKNKELTREEKREKLNKIPEGILQALRLDTMYIEAFNLENANIHLNLRKKGKETHVRIQDYDFSLFGFELNKASSLENDKRFLFSRQAKSEARGFSVKTPKGDSLNIAGIFIDTDNITYDLRDIYFTDNFHQELVYPTNPENIEVKIPHFSASGLRLYQFVLDQKIDLNELIITEPEINYAKADHSKVAKSTSSIAKHENKGFVYPFNPEKIAFLGVENLQIKNGKAKYNTISDSSQSPLNIGRFNLDAENFKISPDIRLTKENPLFSRAVEFKIEDFDMLLAKNTQNLSIQNLGFSTATGQIFLDDIALDYTININSLTVKDSRIAYQELPAKGEQEGEFRLTDLNATINNITNDDSILTMQPFMSLNASTKIMGKSNLNANFIFDLKDPKGKFSFNASMGQLDYTILNEFIVPVFSAHINSGMMNEMELWAEADDKFAAGEMAMYYEDLNVAFLNAKNPHKTGIVNSLGSIIANSLVKTHHREVPFAKAKYIYFERNKYKSLFNYWIKIAVSGVTSNIGLGNHKKKIKKIEDSELKRKLHITHPVQGK